MSHGPLLAALFLLLFALALPATAVKDAGQVKGTVTATTAATSGPPAPISGARITLVNRDLPEWSVKTVTNEAGRFVFTGLPAASYELTVEAAGLPTARRDILLTSGATLDLEIQLTASVSEAVTVHDEEGLLSTAETTTRNIMRSDTLKDTPLRAENYQSALPFTPGVVRDSNGDDHLKGAGSGESAYTVNGADVTDPVTGKLAFDVPIEAAASVQIEENPYSAEFGRLTGGATNLETKGGGDKLKFTAARFFPTFRYIIGGPIDSFRPRLTLSGPVLRDRLFFLQSFEYRFSRVRVPNLAAPGDASTSEAFNSFTQFDLKVNKNNRVKVVAAFFPQKARFVGLNTFNPQETTPNIKQDGALLSFSEQAIFDDVSFWTSAFNYKTFNVDVYAQGPNALTLLPDGNSGNYFAGTSRRTRRLQWQETYFARPFTLKGQHSIKLGAELNSTKVTGRFSDNSILILRHDHTLAQRIDFAGTGSVDFKVGDVAAFVQDRWTPASRLTIDGGLRFDRDGIAERGNIAPRLSFLFLPLKNDKTIIRGGIGLFYDRTPLSAGYLEEFNSEDNNSQSGLVARNLSQLPERVVTRFAADGSSVMDGPRRFSNTIDGRLSNPRSVRFSLQVDRVLAKGLTGRIGYLQRSTVNDFIIDPRVLDLNQGMLALSSSGRSSYHELQLLAIYNSPRFGNWNASYVWSKSQGDLNTVDRFLGDLPALVARPNAYGPLTFDTPHRFIAYGQFKLPHDINISPSFEIRSGFPFSIVNEQLDFVGPRNQQRFPTFISLDAQITKGFRVPRFEKKARVGVAVFNITNHFNPRDVQNNLGSPFGKFFNSLGTSVRGKFELDF